MILGYVMMGIGLSGIAGIELVYPLCKKVKDKKRRKNKTEDKKELTLSERGEIYTQLFTNMGIMKGNDWIRVNKYESTKCYYMTVFTLSDSLPLSVFAKRIDDIKNKLGVDHLEIFSKGTDMCFRVRRNNIPLEKYTFTKPKRQTLIQLGVDLDGEVAYWDLTKDPHLGIFAESGAGKSRLQHGLICSIIQAIPRCKLYLIDLKNGMEFGRYKDLPNVIKFAKDVESAKAVIAEVSQLINERAAIMEKEGYTDYNEYVKDKPRTNLVRIFLIIDEFADLVDDKKQNTKGGKVEGYDAIGKLNELGRKARAVGIALMVGTQRPTVDFIPASLKANLGCIIGMKVLNERNSQLIIDEKGLEELEQSQAIGKLAGKYIFFQSFFIDNKMIKDIVSSFMPETTSKIEISDAIQETRYEVKDVVDVDYEDVIETGKDDEDDDRI